MTLQTELCLCPDISTVDSQIKDSSNSFRRRHSNEVFFEDIPTKALMPNLGSTKPKPLSFKLCICMID
jgi:hypothetical protein